MHEATQLILAILGFALLWTTTVVGVVVWLESKFRRLEKLFYKELYTHTEEDDSKFENHGRRIQRLEIKSFGFTHAGIDQGPPPPV